MCVPACDSLPCNTNPTTARWLLAVSVLAEGCKANQDRLVALGAAEVAMQVRRGRQ